MIVQNFNLNMLPQSNPVIVHVNQYDEGTGRFIVNLYKGNEAYTPSAGATAVIQGTKPDGKGFSYSATISGSMVTANLTKQMSAVAGSVRAQIVITEGDNITGTFAFCMEVQKSGLPADTDMSESEYQLIVQATEEARASATSANAAMISAQISATSADAAMLSAWRSATSADAAMISAQNSATSANTAMLAAQLSATSADTAMLAAQSSAEDSEAWAVGKRDGVDVDADDETYHNNSMYFAQQAGDAATAVAGKMDIDGSNAASEVTFTGAFTVGSRTGSVGTKSVAEGNYTTASGGYSHAEGDYTTASGNYSHAEGCLTTASGTYSHAEGWWATASGFNSHTEGILTTASGYYSHAEGDHTRAGSKSQHVQGKYNIEDTNNVYAHIVGGGTSDNNRANIETLDWNGNLTVAGNMIDGSGNVLSNKQDIIEAITSTDPYTYRQGKGNLADMEIVGASVGWNQLVANSGTVSVTVPSGHKYLSKISGSWSISQSSGTAISSLAGGTDMIIDLTLLFGSTIADAIYAMEQATAGAGVAFFRKYFPKEYYAYDAGSVQSVCIASRKVYDADSNLIATYPFDSTKELRGLFSLVGGELKASGDIYTADGNIQRKYGIVDLGTWDWIYDSTNTYFRHTVSNVKEPAKLLCARYTYLGRGAAQTIAAGPDKSIYYYDGGSIRIKDTAYTDADTFKTAMSGVYLVYELATPTTETAQPYQNPQRAYIDGTEEFTDGLTRDVMIPVGNSTTYQQDKILPSIEDYVDAVAEPKADISAIGTNETGATASKAYSTGQYFYRNGNFCKAKTSIAVGATFTLNTNYEITSIAAELFAALNS